MNAIKNKVQLVGRLGDRPEVYTFDDGNKKAKISLATNATYKNKQGDLIDETTWHNVVAFGKVADLMDRYLDKGAEVALEGRLTNRSYENKKGEKRYVTEIIVSELYMMGKRA